MSPFRVKKPGAHLEHFSSWRYAKPTTTRGLIVNFPSLQGWDLVLNAHQAGPKERMERVGKFHIELGELFGY